MSATNLLVGLPEKGSPPPPYSMDDKTNRYIDFITKGFKYQSNPNSCETTCIYNVLHELGDRHGRPEICFPEAKVNQICGYKHPVGPNLRVVIPNLNSALKATDYSARDRSRATYHNLRDVLTDTSCSYPLVGVSYEYLRDEHGYKRTDGSDHVLVIFKLNDVEATAYDPFMGISPSVRRKGESLGKGIVLIKTANLLEYWENAIVSTSWMLWIRRQTVKSPTLEAFTGSKEVEVPTR